MPLGGAPWRADRSLHIFTSTYPGNFVAAGLKIVWKLSSISCSLAGSTERSTCSTIGLCACFFGAWAPAPLRPAVAASIAFRYDRRFINSSCALLVKWFLARYREFDAIDTGAGGNIKRLTVFGPSAVRRCLGRF